MTSSDRWRPTAAHARAVIGALVLTITAVLARRPDLAVLAMPFAGAAVWAAVLRPTTEPDVHQHIGHRTVREGEATTWHISVDDPGGRIDEVAAVLAPPAWTDLQPIEGQVVIDLRHDGHEPLDVAVRATRWGTRPIGPALVVATSAWAGFRWTSRYESDPITLVALPQPSPFDAAAPPVRTPGLIGGNRSPRRGDGSEFAGIRPFQPGDRLRRIHWARSQRTGTLHVSATWADHDRHVVLLIDAIEEVGASEGVDGRPSSLDITVRAAGAIAEHYITAGDRVALVTLGARGVHRVPAASGHRHLRRILDVLARTQPANASVDDGRMPRGLGSGALVLMLSPLTSPAALQRAMTIAGHGLSLLVIDCLPSDIARREPGDSFAEIAWRIELLKREREIRRVREAGIAVVPWRGPGSLDAVLRDLHHLAGSRARARQ